VKIKIGVRNYDFKWQDEIIEFGGELYGKHNSRDLTITLASKFPQVQRNETFLHELIHAICFMNDLREIEENEHWIQLLATGLLMVIKDNPNLFTMAELQPEVEEAE